jgi:hypothetical protein
VSIVVIFNQYGTILTVIENSDSNATEYEEDMLQLCIFAIKEVPVKNCQRVT